MRKSLGSGALPHNATIWILTQTASFRVAAPPSLCPEDHARSNPELGSSTSLSDLCPNPRRPAWEAHRNSQVAISTTAANVPRAVREWPTQNVAASYPRMASCDGKKTRILPRRERERDASPRACFHGGSGTPNRNSPTRRLTPFIRKKDARNRRSKSLIEGRVKMGKFLAPQPVDSLQRPRGTWEGSRGPLFPTLY